MRPRFSLGKHEKIAVEKKSKTSHRHCNKKESLPGSLCICKDPFYGRNNSRKTWSDFLNKNIFGKLGRNDNGRYRSLLSLCVLNPLAQDRKIVSLEDPLNCII